MVTVTHTMYIFICKHNFLHLFLGLNLKYQKLICRADLQTTNTIKPEQFCWFTYATGGLVSNR